MVLFFFNQNYMNYHNEQNIRILNKDWTDNAVLNHIGTQDKRKNGSPSVPRADLRTMQTLCAPIYQIVENLCVTLQWTLPIGEGNGNPLQYSCLENPMDRGA